MKSTSSSTYDKMRALREAQKLGCSGAHKNSDGRWMPCSSQAKLTEVAPHIALRTRSTISQNRSQRALKGSNKIKKQWENLGERGVLNLSNLSGGGLVSGSSTGSFGGDVGGMSAKALPNIFGPRDNDVDVFTDIESARQRARQLGCIGVSRRISKTGSTVWMPCTNMSDYASRAGTTALGRRHQQARLERVVNEAIEKRLRRDARRQKKSLSEDITFKALGGGIGGRIGRPAAFDPNAWDGDNDGRVQDNTPYERPSTPGVNALSTEGMRSRNRPNINIDEARQRSTESGDTAFTELTLSKKAKKLAAKYLKSFEETFEPVDDRYQFYSDDEIIALLKSNMATSEEQLKEILRENPFTKSTARTAFKRIMQARPDFEATQTMRDKLIETIRNNPGAIEMIRRYGVPPIIATDYVPAFSWFGNTMETWSLSGGGWSHMGFIAMNPFWSEGAFGYKIEDALRHEMAHAWEAMAATQNDRAREHYALQFAEMYESLFQIAQDKNSDTKRELGYQDAAWGTQEEHDSAAKISQYATVARMEWLAESVAALSSADANKRASVDYVAKENISEAFGIPLWEVEQIFTPTDKFGGFRSQISDIPEKRDPNNPSLGDFIKERYGDDSEVIANLRNWVQGNPQYMSDVPLSVQLSSRPETHAAYRRSVVDGFRSYSSSGVIGSGGREMGRKILDRVDPDAANQVEPTLYFVGGTTGSGKSTLVQRGIMEGVPNENQSAHIDPDEIKTGLVGWNGGQGASAVHQASRVATDKIMKNAADQRMHMVVQGTGKRREHLIDMKRRGYKTSGHFVWVPDDMADQRVAQRKQRGGANIPTYFGSQIAHELRSGPSSISRQITDGLYDEFFLYDNSGDVPRLVAKRLSDGSFEIMDDAVFDSFFSKTGADFVRDYWKKSSNSGGMRSRATAMDNSGDGDWEDRPGEIYHEVMANPFFNDDNDLIDLTVAKVRFKPRNSPIKQATYNPKNGDLVVTYKNGTTFTYERVPRSFIGTFYGDPGFGKAKAKPFDADFVRQLKKRFTQRSGGRHLYDSRYQRDFEVRFPQQFQNFEIIPSLADSRRALSRWGRKEKTQIPINESSITDDTFIPAKITWDDKNKKLIVTYQDEGTFTYSGLDDMDLDGLEKIDSNTQQQLRFVRGNAERNKRVSMRRGGTHAPDETIDEGLQGERARWGMRSRNDRGPSVRMDFTLGGMVFDGFGPRTPITSRDLEQYNLRLADMGGSFIDARADFRNRRADFINLSRAHANAVNFASSSLFGSDLSNISAMNSIFGDGKSKPTDLRYSILSAGQFVGSQFDGVNMSGSYMVSTNMRNAKFRNADFSGAVMWDVDFRGADLRGSNITKEQLLNSRFDETTKLPDGLELPIRRQLVVASTKPMMPKIPISIIAGDDIDLIRSNMNNGRVSIDGPIENSSIELRRRDLSQSEISNTSLSGSTLDGSSLVESRLENINLTNSSLFRVNMSKSELTSVDFSKSLLSGSSFRGATLGRGISFRNANLSDVDFRGARVIGRIDLRGADLNGAILHGVDLRNAIFDERTNFSNAIGLDKNKLPESVRKGRFRSRSYASMSSEEINSTPGKTLLAKANDSLVQIGKFKNAKRTDDDVDNALTELSRIYDYLNNIPGLIEDAIQQRTDIDNQLKRISDAIEDYGTFTLPDGSTVNVAKFIADRDRSGYVRAIKSSGLNVNLNMPLQEWGKIESLLFDKDRLNEQRTLVVDDLNFVRNKSNSAVAAEAMLSDYGVMNNLNNIPDFSIAEPLKPRRPRPTAGSNEMRPRDMAEYNSISRPTISKIPKSARVERAIRRVDGMASKSKPTSQRARASRAQEIYQSVSDAIVSALEEADSGKWERPWNLGMTIPRNASTGKQYNGFNILLFALVQQARGYEYPIWATYKQWESLGAQVQKGEKGLTGVKWTARERDVPLPDGTTGTDSFMVPSAFTVFNIAQVSGASPDDFLPPRLSPEERLPALEEIFGEILPEVRHGNTESAHYSPSGDYINMPPFESFKDALSYYATLSHELIHWTGHPTRENRQNMNKFGTPEYAFEELVAELGSAYLMAILGMEATPQEQHSQYIRSWIKILKDDPTAIQRASAQAQKAVDFLIEKSPKLKELSTPIELSQQELEEA